MYSFAYLELTVVPCPVLTVTSWPHTDFSGGRSGGLVFPSLEEFSRVCCDPHSQGFGIINKAEVDIFLKLSCFFGDETDVGNLISGSSTFSKSSLNIQKFMVHKLLKTGLENFEHYFASVWDVQLYSSLSILWHCLSLGLEWKLIFSSPVATAEFSKFAGILSAALPQHHLLGFEIAQLEFHHLPYLCLKWCFLKPTWLRIPGCLALGEWSHHHDYLGHEDLFGTVLLCILAPSS